MVGDVCLPLEGIAGHEAFGYLKGVGHNYIIMNLSIIETETNKTFNGRLLQLTHVKHLHCKISSVDCRNTVTGDTI